MPKVAKVPRTRTRTESSFGQPTPLPQNRIPLESDVCHALAVEDNDIASLAGSISDIYVLAGIPVIEGFSVEKKVEQLADKMRSLLKYPQSKKNATFKAKIKAYDRVFDICPCKCVQAGISTRPERNVAAPKVLKYKKKTAKSSSKNDPVKKRYYSRI